MDYEKKNFGINAGLRYDNKNLELVDATADFVNIDYEKTFNSTSYSAGIFYKLLDHISEFHIQEPIEHLIFLNYFLMEFIMEQIDSKLEIPN